MVGACDMISPYEQFVPNRPSFIFWSLNIGLVCVRSTRGLVSFSGRGAVGLRSSDIGVSYCVGCSLRSCAQPSLKGSRVAPVSSTHTDLTSVYSLRASAPFSRPSPLCPNPPKGA